MANEDKKDFNAMLHDNKDMPKFQTITDPKSIEKYGGSKMYFAPPIDYDKVMKKIPTFLSVNLSRIEYQPHRRALLHPLCNLPYSAVRLVLRLL